MNVLDGFTFASLWESLATCILSTHRGSFLRAAFHMRVVSQQVRRNKLES